MDEVDAHMSLRICDVPLELPLRLLRDRDTCSVYRDGRDSGELTRPFGREQTQERKRAEGTEEEKQGDGGRSDNEREGSDLASRAGEITAAHGLVLASEALAKV